MLRGAGAYGLGPADGGALRVAQVLLGAALGPLHLLMLFGKSDVPTPRKQVKASVDLALQVCGFAPPGERKT